MESVSVDDVGDLVVVGYARFGGGVFVREVDAARDYVVCGVDE